MLSLKIPVNTLVWLRLLLGRPDHIAALQLLELSFSTKHIMCDALPFMPFCLILKNNGKQLENTSFCQKAVWLTKRQDSNAEKNLWNKFNFYLKCGQAIESCGVNCFRGDVGDICYKLLQISAGLLQVGCVNDDLHQL